MAVVPPSVRISFVAALLLAAAAPARAQSIATPGVVTGSYVQRAARAWLPNGLLDRMRLAPFHMSATSELSSLDRGDTASLTLHAQMSTECSCNIGIYGTLPTSIGLVSDPRRAFAAGVISEPMRDEPRTQLGTLDVGLFGGTRGRTSWIYRIGTMLPTAPRDPAHEPLPSARVGDRVLELPRSAGARLSTSWQREFRRLPRMCSDLLAAFRIDAGLDVASVLAHPGNPVHVIPRAGAGMQVTLGGALTYSLDTALSLDPFVGNGADLRWSTGVTARYARADGQDSRVQPALTVASTRTPEGWGVSVLLDLTASAPLSFGR